MCRPPADCGAVMRLAGTPPSGRATVTTPAGGRGTHRSYAFMRRRRTSMPTPGRVPCLIKNRAPSRTSSAWKLAPRASGNLILDHGHRKDARPNTIGRGLSTRRFGEPVSGISPVSHPVSGLRQLVSLPGQQLPVATLLLPDLQCADFGACGLAVQFAFRNVEMAG